MKTKLITHWDTEEFEKQLNESISTINGKIKDIKFSSCSYAYPSSYNGESWGFTE